MLDSFVDGVIAVNEKHEIEYSNPACSKLLGRVPSRSDVCCLTRALSANGPQVELTLPHESGRCVWIRVRAQASSVPAFPGIRILALHEIDPPPKLPPTAEILEGVQEGVMIGSQSGELTFVNSAAARILGYDSVESVGANLDRLMENYDVMDMDGNPIPRSDRAMSSALRGVRLSQRELSFSHRVTGHKRVISYNATPVFDDCGKVAAGIVGMRDITEQKQAQSEAEELHRGYRVLADAIPQIVWTSRPDGFVDYYNSNWFEYTGLSLEQTIEEQKSVLHPEDLSICLDRWRNSLATGALYQTEFRLRRAADGMFRWHLARALPVRDASGHIVKWFGTCTDVHESKMAEERLSAALEALQRSETRFRRMSDANILGIAFWNKNGTIAEANDAYLRLVGRSREDLKAGRVNWKNVTPPEYAEVDNSAIREVFARGVSTPFEKEYLHANGHRVPVLVGLALLDGDAEEGVAFAIDLTIQKTAEHGLRRSNHDLQQFAFVASHDLQDPLRMVTSYSQLLHYRHKDKLGPEALEYLRFISDGTQRMGTLIRDLLEFSRAGSDELKPAQRTELAGVIEWAKMNLHMAVQESGASILFENLPVVSAEPGLLARLFQNLIGNSIKYRRSEPPVIRISADQTEDEWIIHVSDNGMGFDPVFAEQIFGAFKRLHGRDWPGSGLGLAICRRIVERHGGRIWADSTPGVGSTFHFTIPAG